MYRLQTYTNTYLFYIRFCGNVAVKHKYKIALNTGVSFKIMFYTLSKGVRDTESRIIKNGKLIFNAYQ